MWQDFIEVVTKVNGKVNDFVWGPPMIIMLLGTGILLTIVTKFLQVRKFGTSVNETLGETFRSVGKKKNKRKENSISPFEAFATAISGTVGTGNIVGVTSAIMTGGPGAVFWMWVSAFFGMVTNYSENVLGMYFRKKDKDGEISGGPAYYLSEGMGRNVKGGFGSFLRGFGKVLGVSAAVFCTFAAIGMSGVQTTKMTQTVQAVFNMSEKQNMIIAIIVGVVVAVVLALIIIGGIKGIGRTTALLVPFMSLIFIVMSLIIICANITHLGDAFGLIFNNIFKIRSVAGGIGGYMTAVIAKKGFALIMQKGLARGIFSNEAGLGSSVIAHSASATREPVKQGLWGIFEVFFDTFIICTLTALVVLVTFGNETDMNGILYAVKEGTEELLYADTQVSMMAFSKFFGWFGKIVYVIMLPLFAFTTILAWAYYGEKSVDFLFRKTGKKGRKISTIVFKVLYVVLVFVAALMVALGLNGDLAWAIEDTANGLMALPNLVGLIFMSVLVARITKNYFDRKKGKDVAPMLSVYPEQNEEFAQELKEDEALAQAEEEVAVAQESVQETQENSAE